MGWGRYLLLGDLGQQLDLQDRQREMQQLRGHLDSQWSRDQDQDVQIQALRTEVQNLKLYMASLVKLLAAKGVVNQAEVQDMVRSVDGT
ncbi:MAG TPA: hypothetical protein VH518_24835 [Tepidisphaeraceae bacterium]|jgi:hypothetical protein